MTDLLKLLSFLLAYVVLMKWVLPWLGVPTCMSGACGTVWPWKSSTGKKHKSDHPGKTAPER